MPKEISAGAIIFRRNKKIKYLLLHYPSGRKGAKFSYWDFPKGHIEKKESPKDTAKREVFEETGIEDLKFLEGFKQTIKYFFKDKQKTIFKIVIFLLAETKTKKVKISFEHIGYGWFSYQEALKKLNFKNSKELLKKADIFLKIKK